MTGSPPCGRPEPGLALGLGAADCDGLAGADSDGTTLGLAGALGLADATADGEGLALAAADGLAEPDGLAADDVGLGPGVPIDGSTRVPQPTSRIAATSRTRTELRIAITPD